MNIITWEGFAKRKNSTLQPAAADGTTHVARLKENTSTSNPVFILQGGVSAVNYARAFSRYYFVDDVVSIDNNMHELHCSIDVLATYRSTIRSYTAFVERAASSYDQYIRDPALSMQQKYVSDTITETALTGIFSQNGMYVIPVMNKIDGHVLYCTNKIDWIRSIVSSGCYTSTDIADWISSKIASAFDIDIYIGAILWMPLNIQQVGVVVPQNRVAIGPLGIGPSYLTDDLLVKGAVVTASTGVLIQLTLPSAYYGDFRDADPDFTQYSITLPGIGTAPIDTAFIGSCILNGIPVYDQISIDIATGLITHNIMSGSSHVRFCDFKGSIAVDVPLGKARANTIETLTTYIGGVGSGVGGMMGGSAGGIASGIAQIGSSTLSAIKSAYCPQVSMIGGSGNHYDLYINSDKIRINRKIFGSKQFPTAEEGRPLCQNVQLSTLSGFVKCGNASVPISGYDQDKEAVNGYLNSGFYME